MMSSSTRTDQSMLARSLSWSEWSNGRSGGRGGPEASREPRRRDHWVGAATVATILANRVAHTRSAQAVIARHRGAALAAGVAALVTARLARGR